MRKAVIAYAVVIPLILGAITVGIHNIGGEGGVLQNAEAYSIYVKGSDDLEHDRFEQALKDYDECKKLSPKWAMVYNQRACALQGLNRHKEAIEDCNIGIKMEPNCNTYATRGFSYGQLGDIQAEIRDYDTAIGLDKAYGAGYAYRARAYQKLGNEQAAAKDRLRAKKLHFVPSHFDQQQLEM